MSILHPVPFLLAPLPKAGRFLSWCLNSSFSWIRKAANSFQAEKTVLFRHEEAIAIHKANQCRGKISAMTDRTAKATKSADFYLEVTKGFLVKEVKIFPEVKRILSDARCIIDERKEAEKKSKESLWRNFYRSPIKPKPIEITYSTTVLDFNGALEVDYPAFSR